MIFIYGHEYELPTDILFCPSCRRGTLTWDGHWGWRCNHEWIGRSNGKPTLKKCLRGFSLAGLFEDSDLEMKFLLGPVNLADLVLTDYAQLLIQRGALDLSWAPRDMRLPDRIVFTTREEDSFGEGFDDTDVDDGDLRLQC